MESKESKDDKQCDRRDREYSGSGGGRSYRNDSRDKQDCDSRHYGHGGRGRYGDRRGEFGAGNDVSRSYGGHRGGGGSRYDDRNRGERKRSRSRDRDRFHGIGGSNRDYSPDRKRYGKGNDSRKPFRKPDAKFNDPPAQDVQEKEAGADEVDDDDLRPISLNITCPAATNLVQQIEKRKLLFSKKDTPLATTAPSSSSSVWQKTTFSDDSDGKVSAKFKRLMGMKDGGGVSAPPSTTASIKEGPVPATQSKDFFSKLEKEYEVARTITHTQRGVGLGFGSSGGGILPNRTTTWIKPPPK